MDAIAVKNRLHHGLRNTDAICLKIEHVMDCTIGMQLHSHGLVKTYVMMDCTIGMQLHSHSLVKNLGH